MAIIGSVRIKVDTNALKAKADTVTTEISAMEQRFDQLEAIIKKTASYWIGEAGDEHRRLYEEQKDEIDKIMRRLKEHPIDLKTMAGVYEKVETEAVTIGQSLNGNVIE